VLPLALDIAVASDAAQAAVEAGDRSLVRLLGRIRSVEIPAAEWLALDPTGQTLLDVDRPADLERIRREMR
jgi:molybdopterin-guanine dinucleotide biosynthesis protein A